jgi:hypothetical protein
MSYVIKYKNFNQLEHMSVNFNYETDIMSEFCRGMTVLTVLYVRKGWILTNRDYLQVGSSAVCYWMQINTPLRCLGCMMY